MFAYRRVHLIIGDGDQQDGLATSGVEGVLIKNKAWCLDVPLIAENDELL